MSDNLKLHLGCGDNYLPGFKHIDIDPKDHLDWCGPMSDLSMFEDETVDEIYVCGSFHYFDREEAKTVLKEWKRVLKPSAKLRIAGVGDFEKIIQVYLDSGRNLNSRGILGPLFGRWFLKTESKHIYQKTCYDFESLRGTLLESGFSSVRKYDWQDFLPEGYDDYSKAYIPHMDTSGILLCLNVECEKC